MRCAVLHGEVPEGAPADEQDVLAEVGAVTEALRGLGHEPYALSVSLELKALADALLGGDRPGFAFNLVESLDGKGRLIHLAPAVLDSLRIPYTGSKTAAIFMTSNKLIAKRTMRLAGIPTPDWYAEEELKAPPARHFVPPSPAGGGGTKGGGEMPRLIVKSVWEHASIGIDEGSVVDAPGADELIAVMEARRDRLGGECFAEAYVEGREFNISVVEVDGAPVVLPHAEIVFTGFAEGRPRLVDYKAKWDEGSPEYRGTVRSFEFPESDQPLLAELTRLTLSCWRVFGLSGYARVDFRVDEGGRPWVLEVNINPCISPDAGLAAAAGRAGIGYAELVGGVVKAALKGRGLREGRPA